MYLQYWPLNPKLIDRILWIPVPDVWTEIERQREREKERERERMREREREKERERDMPNWKTSFAESEECWPGWIWHSRFGGRRKSERGRERVRAREREETEGGRGSGRLVWASLMNDPVDKFFKKCFLVAQNFRLGLKSTKSKNTLFSVTVDLHFRKLLSG